MVMSFRFTVRDEEIQPGQVRQDEPCAERIAGAGLIEDARGASVPRVKALVARVAEPVRPLRL